MTDQELKDLVAGLAIAQAKTDEQLRQNAAGFEDLRTSQAKTDEQLRKTDEQLRQTGEELKQFARDNKKGAADLLKQMGDVMRGLGYTAEGLAIPSLKRIMLTQLGMESAVENATRHRNGKNCEYDVFGYANSTTNTVIIAEVKNKANDAAIEQLLSQLEQFHEFYPEHHDKQAQGLLAAVHFPEGVLKKARNLGLHIARLEDDLFTLQDPKGFVAKGY